MLKKFYGRETPTGVDIRDRWIKYHGHFYVTLSLYVYIYIWRSLRVYGWVIFYRLTSDIRLYSVQLIKGYFVLKINVFFYQYCPDNTEHRDENDQNSSKNPSFYWVEDVENTGFLQKVSSNTTKVHMWCESTE